MLKTNKIISLDIGATNIKASLFIKDTITYPKMLSDVKLVKTNAISKDSILRSLDRAIEIFLNDEVEGIAISSAGTINQEKKCISFATDNLPGMTGFNYQDYIGNKYHLPTYVINDGHAALLGEMYYGVGSEYLDESICMLTLGSGVGGAYYVQGNLVNNKKNDDSRFGHIILYPNTNKCTCGKIGCVETFLSGRAINRRARDKSINTDTLFINYLKDNPKEKELMEEIIQDLSKTLDKIMQVSPFDKCIIGGGVIDWMGNAFYKIIENIPYKIMKAKLGNMAGVYGAVINYLKNGK